MDNTHTHRLHELLRSDLTPPRVYAAIDPAALTHNYRLLADRAKTAAGQELTPIAVVKADAYGHGIRICAEALAQAGCRAFAVACIEEAVALRQVLEENSADGTVLILGYTAPAYAALLAAHRLTAALVSADHARRMSDAACAAGELESAVREAADILALPGLRVDGMFSHFAEADADGDAAMQAGSRTMTQYARFAQVRDALAARGLRPGLCHICNSAAAVRFPAAHPDALPDAVRLGISLYGYGVPLPDGQALLPVMRLCTSVVHLHTLLPGERVGYGGIFTADSTRLLATLPVGYADGWIRALAGASVTVHTAEGDRQAPLVGRICMDQCMADVTGLPVRVGDPVTLFGQTPEQLEALAARAGTIPYELLCLITARVPRIQAGSARI